jgi:hypothetical protein
MGDSDPNPNVSARYIQHTGMILSGFARVVHVNIHTWTYSICILLQCYSAQARYGTPSLAMAEFAIQTTKWKEVTLEEALDDDWDMIPTLTAFAKTREYCQHLNRNRIQLERIISRHLGIPSTDFVLLSHDHWVWGSFNICLPLDIKRTNRTSKLPLQAILRLPLPFRCGEEYSPGNVEEKLRCEAATYIWLQQNCPSIPTPRLLAIGLPGTESVGRCSHRTSFFM